MKWLVLILCMLAAPLWAVEPDEILSDPALEARARAISAHVRCVVCQNEPIDSSNAGVARDLRLLVRERIMAGDSDAEIYDYLVARYGDFVLFRPPFKRATYVLWLAPFGMVAGGAIAVGLMMRRKNAQTPQELSPEDEAAFAQLGSDGDSMT